MWIFWITFFILSSATLLVFIKKHKTILVISDNSEIFLKSSILFKNVIIQCIHSRAWLAIVNNIEKALRKIRILFLKSDNFVLGIINKVRGHSSKIVQKNLENQENARKNIDESISVTSKNEGGGSIDN